MAITPLNEFKNISHDVTTSNVGIYTAPIAVTSIILNTQVANVSGSVGFVTCTHVRGAKVTHIIKGAEVPINDSLVIITGKFVMEEGDQFYVRGNSNGTMELLMSVLETSE
jgi:hypothetical protein